MRVKMNVQTHYGKALQVDDVINVPNEVGQRWVGKGLAEETDEKVTAETGNEPVEPVDDQTGDQTGTKAYADMDAKELYGLAKERGIDAEARKSKEHYIGLLEADDIKNDQPTE